MKCCKKANVKIMPLDSRYMPIKGSEYSAGYDLKARVLTEQEIPPGQWHCIPTGIFLDMSPTLHGEIVPRSGLALYEGITVLNAPGIIDPDYRGELKVLLYNASNKTFIVKDEMRIAQLLIKSHINAENLEVIAQVRADKGFGSSGN